VSWLLPNQPPDRCPKNYESCLVAPRQSELGQQLVALLPRLRRFAIVLTHSSDAADDLVQVSLTRALERESQWTPGPRLDHWVFQIVRSVWINHGKSARLRQIEALDDHEDQRSMDGAAAMEAKLTLDEVRASFARLPAGQQRALLLVSVDGYSYREAAEILAIPIGTVISRIVRGRAALAERNNQTDNKVTIFRRKQA
jgi:RNA polymerase sigma-70 factor (ECF subfamily)